MGQAGNDTLVGGAGEDFISGGLGTDRLFGSFENLEGAPNFRDGIQDFFRGDDDTDEFFLSSDLDVVLDFDAELDAIFE